MARKIGVAMTVADEKKFLEFLRSTADIQLMLPHAPDIESIY